MVVGMWTVVYRKLHDSGDRVTLWKSSEATARQDFADRVKRLRPRAIPSSGWSVTA
jgi:hypothetical protein